MKAVFLVCDGCDVLEAFSTRDKANEYMEGQESLNMYRRLGILEIGVDE
jgi:hypothetical protein